MTKRACSGNCVAATQEARSSVNASILSGIAGYGRSLKTERGKVRRKPAGRSTTTGEEPRFELCRLTVSLPMA